MRNRTSEIARTAAVLCAVWLASATAAAAQEALEPAAPEAASRWAVGFQSAWPTWGLSGSYDVNERITAQAILGAFGTLSSVGARGLYRFNQQEAYDLYGFGTAGLWSYTGITRETVVGVGGGAGVELDWRRLIASDGASFPPLFSTIDLGLVLANFEHYNFSGITMGVGLHYRF